MLSSSSEAYGYGLDIAAVADPEVPSGVPGGGHLIAMVDAFLLGATTDQVKARRNLVEELGPAAFVDAAAVFGNFEMMNRIAEGTGIPIARQAIEREAETMRALGLHEILKSQHG